jgi:RNAse (barnase) inhibitor barstar
MKIHKIDADEIDNWDKFHDYFFEEFSFPGYYGRNMNAWIDCMSDLTPEEGHIIHINNIKKLKEKNMEIYEAIIECTAFVNWRFTENNSSPVLYLAFYLQ